MVEASIRKEDRMYGSQFVRIDYRTRAGKVEKQIVKNNLY